VRTFIKESNSGVEIVFDQGVPTETSNYTVLLNNIRAANPDAVLHLGYAPNDIAFLRNVQDSGVKFKLLLAHGDFLMLGAFLAFWLFALFAVNPIPVLPIVFAVFVAVGLPLYYLLVPRLLKAKDPEMLSFILFFGLSQVIEAVTTIAFGTSERSIPGDHLDARSPPWRGCSSGTRWRTVRLRSWARLSRRRGWRAASPAAAPCSSSTFICTGPGSATSPAQ